MSKTFSNDDLLEMAKDVHINIIDDLLESIKMYVGKGDDKKVIVSQGLKLKHIPTGLIYTVIAPVVDIEKGVCIVCEKPQGGEPKIPCKDLKNYKRL